MNGEFIADYFDSRFCTIGEILEMMNICIEDLDQNEKIKFNFDEKNSHVEVYAVPIVLVSVISELSRILIEDYHIYSFNILVSYHTNKLCLNIVSAMNVDVLPSNTKFSIPNIVLELFESSENFTVSDVIGEKSTIGFQIVFKQFRAKLFT